ncbi:thymidine phosphorylase [Actinomycetes bacterium KLBMP 9797]
MNRVNGVPIADYPEASARIQSAVTNKRLGRALSPEVIGSVVADFVAGRVPDYQMAAWLATVACRGLDGTELAELTRAYVSGGQRLDLCGLDRPVLDKHSTGGVGDKCSLVVAPVVAACGPAVVKMSGRALGYAGGTIDKLESIAGLRLDLAPDEVYRTATEVGMVITGQSAALAPGDEATYALRDVTGTVESIPLIAASIISKKLTVGADALVLDVKTGAGALIPDRGQAALLAGTMVDLASASGLPCRAVLSDMSQPLGYAVGNALEVREALAVLRGESVPGLSQVCATLARIMLQSADLALGDAEADDRVAGVLSDGSAYELFLRWVAAQGGDPRRLEQPDGLPVAPYVETVTADRAGWVREVEPRAIGAAAIRVGAGRLTHGARIDHAAGVLVHRRVGSRLAAGEPLAEIQYTTGDVRRAVALVRSAFTVADEPPEPVPVIHAVLDPGGQPD